jgi:hypothetical protein
LPHSAAVGYVVELLLAPDNHRQEDVELGVPHVRYARLAVGIMRQVGDLEIFEQKPVPTGAFARSSLTQRQGTRDEDNISVFPHG